MTKKGVGFSASFLFFRNFTFLFNQIDPLRYLKFTRIDNDLTFKYFNFEMDQLSQNTHSLSIQKTEDNLIISDILFFCDYISIFAPPITQENFSPRIRIG